VCYRAASLAPSLRLRSLQRLAVAVHADSESLLEAEGGMQAAACGKGEGEAAACEVEVVDAVWSLARLSAEFHDAAMAALAGMSPSFSAAEASPSDPPISS
jgi:hypothetical protein